MATSNNVPYLINLRLPAATPFSESTLDAVRNIPLGDVAGGSISLRRVGGRLVGLCPFHKEKTPSFSINVEKNVFYCHGCGEGGDVIAFTMGFEHCDFRSAVQVLAQRHGIAIQHGVVDPHRLALREELRSIDQRIDRILKDEQVRISEELQRLRAIARTHTLETLPSNIFDQLRRLDARYVLAVLASEQERVEFLSSSIDQQESRIDEILNDGSFSGWEVPAQ